MATTPTKYDPQILARGTLGTTLTTSLHAAVGDAGDRITGIILTVTGATSRRVTLDIYDGANAYMLLPAGTIPANGVGKNALHMIGLPEGLAINAGDEIRGGQDVGTDVDYIIVGWAMDD